MFRTLLFSAWLLFHPVHVTLTSIDYMTEIGSFKVFVRMYFDDFMVDCRSTSSNIKENDFLDNNSSSRDVIEKYIEEKLVITVNSDKLTGKLQDLKVDNNEISLNLNYLFNKKPKIITVKNLVMTGLHSDQSNMLIIKVNNYEEGVKLTADLTEQTFKIK